MANTVTVNLVANNLITPVLERLKRNFEGLQSGFKGMDSSFNSSFLGNLGASLALRGIDSLTSGVNRLTSSFKSNLDAAAKFETQSLNSSVGISSVANISLGKAQELTKELEKQAALSGASLPGSTSDYVRTSQTISDTVAKAFNLNSEEGIKAFKDTMAQLQQGIGFVAATATSSGADAVNRSFEQFLAGNRTINEMRLIDDVAASPLFKTLDNILEQMGISDKEIKSLTVKQRADLLVKAKKQSLNPETIAAYENTFEGLSASITSYFFDLQVGIFGFRREVEASGNRSVLDASKNFLKTSVLLGGQISRLATALGVSFDPMRLLIDGIDSVSDLMVSWYSLVKEIPSAGLRFDPSDIAAGLTQGIFGFLSTLESGIANGINRISNLLISVFSNLDVGKVLSSIWVGLTNFAADAMMGVNWFQLARAVGLAVGQGIVGLGKFLLTPSTWVGVLRVIVTAAIAVVGLVQGLVVGVFEGLARGFVSTVQSWLQNLTDFLSQPFRAIGDAFQSLVFGITGVVEGLLGALSKIPGLGGLSTPKIENKPKAVERVSGAIQELAQPLMSIPVSPIAQPLKTVQANSVSSVTNNDNRQAAATNNFSVNIQANTNSSPDDIASAVMKAISSGYSSYRSASLIG